MLFNFISRRIVSHARPRIKLEPCCHGLLFLSSSSSSPFTCTPSDSSNQHFFTVNYLINSCGVSPESAILASKHVDLSKSPNTADSVLAFLNDQGFTKTQLSKLVCRHPKILLYNPEKKLLPAFQTLSSIGLSRTDITVIISARPKVIFDGPLQDRALQCFTYLKSVLGSDDKVIKAIKRYPLALTYDLQVYAAGNIKILREIGVPESIIVSTLALHPGALFTSVDRFTKVIEDVKKMGFDTSKTKFLWAVHAVRSMSKSTWDMKMELYKKWGWSKDEIFMAFERCPGCMTASTDKITRILDFLVNTMGREKSYILRWPIVFCFSFEKRIIPRCLVYQYLAEKGLTDDDFCFTNWLMYSDAKFLKWVLKKYEEESSEVLKLYQKHLDEAGDRKSSTAGDMATSVYDLDGEIKKQQSSRRRW